MAEGATRRGRPALVQTRQGFFPAGATYLLRRRIVGGSQRVTLSLRGKTFGFYMANLIMKRDTIAILSKHMIAIATAFTGFLLVPALSAQTFAYANNDLALGFRKTGIHQESYEAVIDIGSATNYVNLQSGTTIPVPNFTAAQLSPDTFSDLNFLSWSVIGFARTNTISVLPGYQNNTLWLTAPRSAPATQSAP